MSSGLCAELRSLQELLSRGQPSVASGARGAHLPPPAAADTSSSSDEEPAAPRRRKIKAAPPPQQQVQVQELERQLATLRQQRAEDGDRCKRLEEALQAAQQDAALVSGRLSTAVAAKNEECAHLAELLLELRAEADGLRAQLHRSAAAAEQTGQSAQASVQQLQAAAAEWRRQGEDALEALADERERSAGLQSEVARLQAQAEHLQRQLNDERERARAASAEAAGHRAAASVVGSPAGIVAELKARLAQERAWRKAVCRWLEGEVATRADLERVLVSVGADARTGRAECTQWGAGTAAPPLPPRRMAASQVMGHAPGSPTAVRVTVHSPPGGHSLTVGVDAGCGAAVGREGGRSERSGGRGSRTGQRSRDDSNGKAGGGSSEGKAGSSGGSSGSRADWRDHFKATMQAFDERHQKLEKELSSLRREALMQATT